MAITNGLNVRLYVEGNDLSGDANSLDGIGYSQEQFDTTTLNQSAVSRMNGRADGSLSVSAFFDAASTHISAVATANSGKLPITNQNVLVPLAGAVGSDSVSFIAKQAEYGVSGGTGSPVTVSVSYSIDGIEPSFGTMLTAHDDTHSSASSGTSVDNAASSASGGAGYLQVFSLSSGTVVAKIEHSANNSTWADLLTFSGATGAGAQRVTCSGTVNRYVRITTTGTFSNAKIACALVRD